METNESVDQKVEAPSQHNVMGAIKFIVLSFIGLAMFFWSFEINGVSAVPIDHFMEWVLANLAAYVPYYTMALVFFGGFSPLVTGKWKESKFDITFTVAKLIGCVIAVMVVFNIGPAFLLAPDMIPFLWDSIVVPISIVLPVAIIGLILMLNYGLLEFFSVFLQPFMRLIWKTPGASALDALISFTNDYSVAVVVTNDLYKKGIYSLKEAVTITTGFSTVSITFFLIMAKTLELEAYWTIFVLSCLVVSFTVSAITVRMYPISKIPNTYYNGTPFVEEEVDKSGNIVVRAYRSGVETASSAKPLLTNLIEGYKGDFFKLVAAVISSILSIGLLGLLVANYTPFFDVLAYLFYPFTLLLQVPDPMLTAKALSMEIAEMFLPSLLVIESPIFTKFVVAVTSVSAVLFFSASIPALLSTDIPIKLRHILIIWVQRTILSLILATIIAYIVF